MSICPVCGIKSEMYPCYEHTADTTAIDCWVYLYCKHHTGSEE